MVPRLHKKGKSFKGAALYVLHDKDKAKTSERLAWTQTRNIGVDDPHTAWKIMAHTSMDQDRLKAQAGVKNTGRKSKDHVLHLSLSWHGDEAEGLTQDEMMRAANQALHALDAGDRQALIAAHNDTDEPHVHIICNRVSQDDGRMLSSSKEKLKLSAWAQTYEQERGKVLCEERVLNNQARGMAKYTRDDSHTPYHIHAVEAANDNKPGFDTAKTEQQSKDAALAAERTARDLRRLEAWTAMESRHAHALHDLEIQKQRSIWAAEEETRALYRPSWEELRAKHTQEIEAWHGNEERFLGRMKNAFSVTDWRSVMNADDRREKLREVYDAFSSSGARLEAVKRSHEAEERELRRVEAATEEERRQAIRQQIERDRMERAALFEAERQSTILTNGLEDAAERAEWQKRNDDRQAAYENLNERDADDARPNPEDHDLERQRRADMIRGMLDDEGPEPDLDRGR